MTACSECSSKEIYAKGKCRRCYNRDYQKRWRHGFMCGQFVGASKMATCHPDAKHYAKGKCRACYVAIHLKEKKREYDAQRYKDRKRHKTKPEVQERVTHNVSPSNPPFVPLSAAEQLELTADEFLDYMDRKEAYQKSLETDAITSKSIEDL